MFSKWVCVSHGEKSGGNLHHVVETWNKSQCVLRSYRWSMRCSLKRANPINNWAVTFVAPSALHKHEHTTPITSTQTRCLWITYTCLFVTARHLGPGRRSIIIVSTWGIRLTIIESICIVGNDAARRGEHNCHQCNNRRHHWRKVDHLLLLFGLTDRKTFVIGKRRWEEAGLTPQTTRDFPGLENTQNGNLRPCVCRLANKLPMVGSQ